MKSVVIQGGLRVFRVVAADGKSLYRSGEEIPAGSKIKTGNPVTMYYDRRSQVVLSVEWGGFEDGERRFVLKDELDQVLM